MALFWSTADSLLPPSSRCSMKLCDSIYYEIRALAFLHRLCAPFRPASFLLALMLSVALSALPAIRKPCPQLIVPGPSITQQDQAPLIRSHASKGEASTSLLVTPCIKLAPAQFAPPCWAGAHIPAVFLWIIAEQANHHVAVNGRHVPILCALEAGQGLGKPGVPSILALWLGQYEVTWVCLNGINQAVEDGK